MGATVILKSKTKIKLIFHKKNKKNLRTEKSGNQKENTEK